MKRSQSVQKVAAHLAHRYAAFSVCKEHWQEKQLLGTLEDDDVDERVFAGVESFTEGGCF